MVPNPRLRAALLFAEMKTTCKRSEQKESEYDIDICYDIYNYDKNSEAKYIGCIILTNKNDTSWRLNKPNNPVFGDFNQCVAELKIQSIIEED